MDNETIKLILEILASVVIGGGVLYTIRYNKKKNNGNIQQQENGTYQTNLNNSNNNTINIGGAPNEQENKPE